MSITVKKLCKNGSFLYKMKLVAGKEGLNNLVSWVHLVEDNEVAAFLHGNELVFTAGILNKEKDWLLNFAKDLNKTGISAFVVNIGPHTKNVPKQVIDFCNKVGMPLFTIPWETRMVDMTRDFCHRIINNEQVELNTATTIKNIIFNIGDINTQVQQMERYGCQKDSRFCFVSITHIRNGRSDDPEDKITKAAERIAKRMHDSFISFSYNGYLILVLVNYKTDEIKNYISEFLQSSSQIASNRSIHIGISSNQIGILNQKTNFEKALSAMEMAQKKGDNSCFYTDLGIYKVLYEVKDREVLREFYKDVIGKLDAYDRENNTELVDMLKTYLDNNGSLQVVAEKQFVHRNTVTNQLKKIEEITGYNPLELGDKMKFSLALHIKKIS